MGKKKVVLKGTREDGALKMIGGKGLTRLIKKSKEGLIVYLFYMSRAQLGKALPEVIEEILQQHE